MISWIMLAAIVGIAVVAIGVAVYFVLYPPGYKNGSTTTSNYGGTPNQQQYGSNSTISANQNPSPSKSNPSSSGPGY